MRTCLPLIVAVMSLLGSACTPGNGPLFVNSVRTSVSGPTGCIPTKENVTSIGMVDVAAPPELEVTAFIGGAKDFFSPTAQPPLSVTSGQLLSSTSRERLVIQKVFLRYSSKPAIPGLTATITDVVPRTLVLSVDSPTEISLQVPLFGANARAKLEALSPSNADSFQFTSTFEIQGVTEPGGAEFRTPPISMPMTLVKTEVTCSTPNDQRLKRFSSPAQGLRGCSFLGLNRRFGPGDCCLTVDASGNPALDLSQPGCDVLP